MLTNFRRKLKKWLYGSCPGFTGSFPYYGTKVYFPKDSYIFNLACEQGVYEHENLKLLLTIIKPNTVYFDIGANIGLMSIPILYSCPTCNVVSFEPSPNALPFLGRTAKESRFTDRWRIIGKAVGDNPGEMPFHIASKKMGAFDGFKDTKRAGVTKETIVPITTIDIEWAALGCPEISVIKIDVEGAELYALEGAQQCLEKEKPFILLEWNSSNIQAYDLKEDELIKYANKSGYKIFSAPDLVPVDDSTTLKIQMIKTETFLLAPK
jgi:FkbM family methyltransferase